MNNNAPWTIRLHLQDTNQIFISSNTLITIGRDQRSDLVLPNTFISRKHATIFFRDDVWYISDNDSINGTWLNGKMLLAKVEVPLSFGDIIDLAHTCKIVFLEGRAPQITSSKNHAMRIFETISQSSKSFSFSHSDNIPQGCASMQTSSQKPNQSFLQFENIPTEIPNMTNCPAPSMATSSGCTFQKIEPTTEQIKADDVQFRCTAPKSICYGEYFPVKIMMYREEDYLRADRESAAVAEDTKSASSSIYQIFRNQIFQIALQSPDIELDCETQQLFWNGKYATVDFEVYLPEDYDKRQLRLHGRVYNGAAVLTDLKLILQIGSNPNQFIDCEKVRLRSAFISYASADRAKVVARIQGIQLACPDMDLFFDVESLRRGEQWEPKLYQEISQRDLFYLFWSKNAAASEWVKKELEFALTQKTIDYIEPIPLESPAVCAPPPSLMCKHFNDWTLRYLQNQ